MNSQTYKIIDVDNLLVIPNWILKASGNAVKLFAVLTQYDNVYPSESEIARHLNWTESKLHKALIELSLIGAINITPGDGDFYELNYRDPSKELEAAPNA